MTNTFLNMVLVRCESLRQTSRAFSICNFSLKASFGAACIPHNSAAMSSSPEPLTINSLITPETIKKMIHTDFFSKRKRNQKSVQ